MAGPDSVFLSTPKAIAALLETLDFAKQQLLKLRLELGKVTEMDCGKLGEPDTVITVSPHSPNAVPIGATIDLSLCSD